MGGHGNGTAEEVRRLIREHAPSWAGELPDALPLSEGGLGFDSVRVVELLLACEDRFGVAFPAETIEERLTVGAVVDRVLRHVAR